MSARRKFLVDFLAHVRCEPTPDRTEIRQPIDHERDIAHGPIDIDRNG